MLPHSPSTKHENPAHLCPFFIAKGLAGPGPAAPSLSLNFLLAFVGFAFILFFCLLSTPSSPPTPHSIPVRPSPSPATTQDFPGLSLHTQSGKASLGIFFYRPSVPAPTSSHCLLFGTLVAKSQQWLKGTQDPVTKQPRGLAGNGLGGLRFPNVDFRAVQSEGQEREGTGPR